MQAKMSFERRRNAGPRAREQDMESANWEHAFRRIVAGLAVVWAIVCVGLALISLFGLAARPSHPFVVTAVVGRYVVVRPDPVAREAGVLRGDRLLRVNGQSLASRPLSQAGIRTEELNRYELQRPAGLVYEVEIPHRQATWRGLLRSPPAYLFLLLLLFPGLYLLVGMGVYRARPEQRSTWALLLLSSFMAGYLAGGIHPGWRPPGSEILLSFSAAMMLVPGFHLVTMYPVRLEAVSRHRRLLAIPYAMGFGLFLIYAGAYVQGRGHEAGIRALLYWNLTVVAAIGLYMVLARRHMPSVDLRERLDITLLGYGVSAIPVGIVFLVQDLLHAALPVFFAFAWFVLFPLVIGVGILRQEVFGIRDVARSSFVYGLLTVAITASYALAVALAGTLYGSYLLGNPWMSFPVIFGLVLLFSPLRERLHSVADELFGRDRARDQQTVRTISEALVSLLSVDEILDRVMWAITGPMGVDAGAVLLLDEDRTAYRLSAARGTRASVGWRIPAEHPLVKLVWGNADGLSEDELPQQVLPDVLERCRSVYEELGVELIMPLAFGVDLRGLVAVGSKRTGDPLRAEDREILRTLANQAAVAVENALAYEEIKHLNQTLELRIEERTRELQETQAALAHREKMASVGQLVAGVAHEINNPIAFVHANLQLVNEQLGQLLEAVRSGERDAAEEARNNIQQLLARGQEGTRRIRAIVQALRNFSRVDQTGMADADLHEGFETTFELMATRLHDIEIVREFGELPVVRCHAGQVNQVLMTLVLNACDAGATRIVVRTGSSDGWIWVEVEDNGSGIPPEHRSRIFEPFFTTKDVGEGTGLGLAIAHGIVERHGGRIGVGDGSRGGTVFRMDLPVRGPDAPRA
jgi:signal transduction histidine kinase